MHPSALELVSVGGRQYGVPYTYYQIGLYFRRDVLDAAGIARGAARRGTISSPRATRLKATGIEPFAIGTRDLWPAAALVRLSSTCVSTGSRFTWTLMQGAVAYTDPRVRARVRPLARAASSADCFSRNHASSSWQESQALLYQGKAAMMLIGNYIVANFPAGRARPHGVRRVSRRLRRDVGRFEDAPMNTVHIPARARNKEDAKRFLALRHARRRAGGAQQGDAADSR